MRLTFTCVAEATSVWQHLQQQRESFLHLSLSGMFHVVCVAVFPLAWEMPDLNHSHSFIFIRIFLGLLFWRIMGGSALCINTFYSDTDFVCDGG